MAKNQDFFDHLADLAPGETHEHGNAQYTRVPGGFVMIVGSTSAFVPLNEVACKELGISFED